VKKVHCRKPEDDDLTFCDKWTYDGHKIESADIDTFSVIQPKRRCCHCVRKRNKEIKK